MQTKNKLLIPAVAALMAVGGITGVMAEGSSSPAEVQRGVPGMDIDMNKKADGGLDVDVQAGNQNDKDNGIDTRTLGAGADNMGSTESANRAPLVDRN
jgi:hypothetical protein